jgi:hypothetical protein
MPMPTASISTIAGLPDDPPGGKVGEAMAEASLQSWLGAWARLQPRSRPAPPHGARAMCATVDAPSSFGAYSLGGHNDRSARAVTTAARAATKRNSAPLMPCRSRSSERTGPRPPRPADPHRWGRGCGVISQAARSLHRDACISSNAERFAHSGKAGKAGPALPESRARPPSPGWMYPGVGARPIERRRSDCA